MELYDYIGLEADKKASLLWEYGTYLMSRYYHQGTVNLYSLEDFYVEVYYNERNNCIEDLQSFRSIDCLEPYLKLIQIRSLAH